MSGRAVRKPNALKHGAFSRAELLPWEDANEYEVLRRGLLEELQPEGPLQEDCVNTILSYMWRKRRVRDRRNLDIAATLDRVENRVLWQEPPPLFETEVEGSMHALRTRQAGPGNRPRDDYQQLLDFSTSLYGELHASYLKLRIDMLPTEFSDHLNEKVPCEKFEFTYQWVSAVKKEVDGVLLPMVRERAPKQKAYFETAAEFLAGDWILQDLDTEDRLDAGIDRAMKRLYQLKMGRQLYQPKEPKLIENNSTIQLERHAKARKTKE